MTTQVAATADPRIKDIGGLASTYLFDMAADLSPLLDTGPGPLGNRLLWPVIGGTFEGPRIRGEVVPAAVTGPSTLLMVPGCSTCGGCCAQTTARSSI
jgi:hypothetical protein